MTTERFIDVNGSRTRYLESGRGPAVVFFHGGQIGSSTDASSAHDWQPLLDRLSQSFRTIAVDRLGQGMTANPRSDADYSMAAAVDHGAHFLRALGIGPCHIVGHSTGGFLVTRLSLEHPDLVRSCVVADGVALYPGIGRDHIVRSNPPLPLHSRESLRWIYERRCNLSEAVTDEWIEQMLAILQTEQNRIAVRKMNDEGLERSSYLPALGKQLGATHRQLLETGMPCPTLLTWSLNDPVGDVSNGRLLIEMFQQKQPQTEVRYFNKAGHFAFREQPGQIAHLLRHYLAAFS